jgi:hypothetical protein
MIWAATVFAAETPAGWWTEKRASELRAAKHRQLAEAEAVEADQLRRALIWKGVPADHMPPGVRDAAG